MNDNIDPDKRKRHKSGASPIKYSIQQIALRCLRGSHTSLNDDTVRRFIEKFAAMDILNESSLLLPQTVSLAVNCAFTDKDLVVLNEVPFLVRGAQGSFSKRLDHLILSKNPAVQKAVAIEVKSTVEFSPFAAAFMEFAVLTERDLAEFTLKTLPYVGACMSLCLPSKGIRCLTISCYNNQDSKAIIDALQRQIWKPEVRQISHHNLFFTNKSRKEVERGTGETVLVSVRELVNEVRDWFKAVSDEDS